MRVDPTTVMLKDGRTLEVRCPGAGDGAATLAFVRQLFHESYRNLNNPPSHFDSTTVDAQQAFLDSIAAHPRNFMLAAWDGDRIVGNANIGVMGGAYASHVAELGLGVLESHQRLGVARALTVRLIEVATQQGVCNLTLRVRTFNHAAIALYESLGFERVGTLRAVARLPDGELADEHLYQRAHS